MSEFEDIDELFAAFNDEGNPEDETNCVQDYCMKVFRSGKRSREDTNNEGQPKKPRMSTDVNREKMKLPGIKVYSVETEEACQHEVAVPPDHEYVPLTPAPGEPAKEYPFVLDPFQKEAILCLENNQSVLVSAHTSAGKTVVAVYAIAMSLRDKQRVIYTSPIKALSNQKYHELVNEFEDVGLMTGDVTINPSASCLVMTTEILRSMLYRGSQIMREVGWVIFDEIHYMRDKERGVVWEETIILLPDNVHYVFLSATIPNAAQFAQWVCHLHHQPCHVVYTEYRPTPLLHYIFPAEGDGLHLVVDENGNFREDNFNTAMASLEASGDTQKTHGTSRRGKFKAAHEASIFKIVKMIMERGFAPVIIFSFSRKECEAYGKKVSELDFNTAHEKKLVEEVFSNAIYTLSDEDKKLPQVQSTLPLLKKGIGIHHSGIIPVLKEVTEILFSEGLIKALFATETFAMGLNMPARTVLFTSARKFDGKSIRPVTSGEYIQMSGRAGRRGLDDRGIVILMVDNLMTPAVGKAILKGSPDPLNSAFHLTFNMVLNLLRVEGINAEYMLERSFYQFQNYSAIPELLDKLKEAEDKLEKMVIEDESNVADYVDIHHTLLQKQKKLLTYIHKPEYLVPFMQPGRLIRVKESENDFGWGVVVKCQKKEDKSKPKKDRVACYYLEALLYVNKESARRGSGQASSMKPCAKGDKGVMLVIPITLHLIQEVSAVRLNMPKDINLKDSRFNVYKMLQAVEKEFPDGYPLLDAVKDFGIKEEGVSELVQRIAILTEKKLQSPVYTNPRRDELCAALEKKAEFDNVVTGLRMDLKKKQMLFQMDELKIRKRVLRAFEHSTSADVILFKGRVACEIASGDVLVITELLYNNVFSELTAAQCCALLSCFVFQEKPTDMASANIPEHLSQPFDILKDTAKRVAEKLRLFRMEIDEKLYVESFRPDMMNAVYEWCNGSSFAKISEKTDIFAGSMIRCMRRLGETMHEMLQAARAIGNYGLEDKFATGVSLIKRDIVSAESLYL